MNFPRHFLSASACSVFLAAWTNSHAMADFAVSNVRSVQRVGTKYVDIDYDLTATGPVTVSVRISDDDGVSFAVPSTSLSGAFGAGMVTGTDKRITWNAGVDWNDKVSPNMRFEVVARKQGSVSGEFALIPTGSFQMGDMSNPLVGDSDELPVHSVQVSAFYMGKYEVSKELWDEVRAWGLNNGYTDLPAGNGSHALKGANHPVHTISWYAMVKWCNARSQKEDLTPCYTVSGSTFKTGGSAPDCNWSANGYRLPSEAEWEKAARGGVAGKNFPWGTDTISHSQANYLVYSGNGTMNYYSYDMTPRPPGTVIEYFHPSYTAGGDPYTAPVNSFTPNGYGLFNMSGNVWEWCWDWYGYYAADSQTDPHGPVAGFADSTRVIRGGGWYGYASFCRVVDRDAGGSPGGASYGIGFRLARSSVP